MNATLLLNANRISADEAKFTRQGSISSALSNGEIEQKSTSRRSFEVENISHPLNSDVLLGRGRSLMEHPGNLEYQKLVSDRRTEYQSTPRAEKMDIARAIVKIVRERCGRFLVRQRGTKLWTDVGDQCAVDKTAKALREGQRKEGNATPTPPAQPPMNRHVSERTLSPQAKNENVFSTIKPIEQFHFSYGRNQETNGRKRQRLPCNDNIQIDNTAVRCESGSETGSDTDELLDEYLSLITTNYKESDMELSQNKPLKPQSNSSECAFEPLPFNTWILPASTAFDGNRGDELANLAIAAADASGDPKQQQYTSERQPMSPRHKRTASDSSIVLLPQQFLLLEDENLDDENTIMSAPEASSNIGNIASSRKRRFSGAAIGKESANWSSGVVTNVN